MIDQLFVAERENFDSTREDFQPKIEREDSRNICWYEEWKHSVRRNMNHFRKNLFLMEPVENLISTECLL